MKCSYNSNFITAVGRCLKGETRKGRGLVFLDWVSTGLFCLMLYRDKEPAGYFVSRPRVFDIRFSFGWLTTPGLEIFGFFDFFFFVFRVAVESIVAFRHSFESEKERRDDYY